MLQRGNVKETELQTGSYQILVGRSINRDCVEDDEQIKVRRSSEAQVPNKAASCSDTDGWTPPPALQSPDPRLRMPCALAFPFEQDDIQID